MIKKFILKNSNKIEFASCVVLLSLFTLRSLDREIGVFNYWLICSLTIGIIFFNSYLAKKTIELKNIIAENIRLIISLGILFLVFLYLSSTERPTQYLDFKYLQRYLFLLLLGGALGVSRLDSRNIYSALKTTLVIFFIYLLISMFTMATWGNLFMERFGRVGTWQVFPGDMVRLPTIIIAPLIIEIIENKKIMNSIYLLIALLIILFDGSRSALLFTFSVLMFVLISLSIKHEGKQKINTLIVLVTAALSIIMFTTVKKPLMSYYLEFKDLLKHDVVFEASAKRSLLEDSPRQQMINYLTKNIDKIKIIGPGSETITFNGNNNEKLSIHNIYLQLLFNNGVVAFLALISVMCIGFKSVLMLYKNNISIGEQLGIFGILSYGFMGMFYPLSLDISVQGFFLICVSVLISEKNNKIGEKI